MADLQLVLQFIVNTVSSFVDVMKGNIFLTWTLYVFVVYLLIRAYSVIWSHGRDHISASDRVGRSFTRHRRKESNDNG